MTAVNVVAALKGTQYEKVSEKLAEEFSKAGITTKEEVHNAPLKLKVTHGVDLYKVMQLIMDYEPPLPKSGSKIRSK